MKIFISLFSGINDPQSETGSIPCFYETIINDLKKSGNDIFVYVSRIFCQHYNKIPVNLLRKIKLFKPDLFILFNNTFWDISKEFDCPILVYEVDSPLFYSNKNSLKSNIDRYKFIVSQDESIQVLKNEFKVSDKNILKTSFFTEIYTEDIPIKHNISFIGTKFVNNSKPNIFNVFMNSMPNDEEISAFKNLIRYYCCNTFLTKNELLSNLNITSEKIIKSLDLNSLIFLLSDYNRTKTLSSIADLGLGLYGTLDWIKYTYNEPELILSYINKIVYSIKHNQDIYNASKIAININHLQAQSGFSWRVCDILASNACLVSEYKPNIEKYFSKAGILMFSNPYEAREICLKLLNNENLRKDIVAASHEIIDSKYRFRYVKKYIEDFLGYEISGNSKSDIKYSVATLRDVLYYKFDDKIHKIIKIVTNKIKNVN